MKFDKKDLLLYAITDRSWLGGETLYAQTEKALRGGATFLQLREKSWIAIPSGKKRWSSRRCAGSTAFRSSSTTM